MDGAGGRALVQRNEQLRFGGVQARDALDDDAQRRLVAEGGADAAHHLRLHVATHLGVALKFQQKKGLRFHSFQRSNEIMKTLFSRYSTSPVNYVQN